MENQRVITISMREIDRLKVIREVLDGKLSRRQAGSQLLLSKRQVIRLCKKVRQKGSGGIIHGLRGKRSNHRLEPGLLDKSLAIVREKYSDFGPTLAHEKLAERHGIRISTNTLRGAMIESGLWKAKKPKRRYRSCRKRRDCLGELVQLDGSEHDWLEGRGDRCALLIYIDDATSRILYGEFVKSESTASLMQSTQSYLRMHGRPVAFYVDKDSIYRINRQASIEEQLRDSQPMTQYARAMQELDIEVIFAHSPQAKGRVERGFKTHQDRLVKELRINGISGREDGNKFLWEVYIPVHNARFAVQPASASNAHRPLLKDHRLEEILSLRTERTVMKDFTLRFRNQFLQILPAKNLMVKPKDKVLVEVRLDHSLHLRFKRGYLAFQEVSKPVKVGQADEQIIIKRHKPPVPAKDHPWRRFTFAKQAQSLPGNSAEKA